MGVYATQRIRAAGFGTGFIDAGDRAAPTVVLIHDGAFGTDANLCWGSVIDELASNYRIIAPDLLGWGASDKLCYFDRSPYDFRLEHIAALLKTLAIDEPVFFAGSSFGAELVARGTAEAQWGWRPRASVSIAGTGGRMFRVPGGIEQLSDYEPSLAAAARLTSFFVESLDGMDDHIQQRFENSLIPGHWEALSALRLRNPVVERQPVEDAWPEPLRTCDVPIHFVEGESDPLLESGWAAQMAEIAARGTSEVIVGSHEPNLDHPHEVAEMLDRFFSAH
jgi:pimeloyl-ACP methyl ester carboxylesterase